MTLRHAYLQQVVTLLPLLSTKNPALSVRTSGLVAYMYGMLH